MNATRWKNSTIHIFLYPLSMLYALVVCVRHLLYNTGVFRSTTFNFPTIVVGNLSMGGTGKTPCTDYLCTLLQKHYHIAIISRGYMRKSRGFGEVTTDKKLSDVGDEPYWLKRRHPNLKVFVGENRVKAVMRVLQEDPFLDIIVFDDAFQHRKLSSCMNILLTSYFNLYSEDAIFPVGSLRDIKLAANRANIIIVTKCPSNLSSDDQTKIAKKLRVKTHQDLFFAKIDYGSLYYIHNNQTYPKTHLRNKTVLLVTGIADPTPLQKWLSGRCKEIVHIKFSDHHSFSYEDILNIIVQYDKCEGDKCILITEKDAVKLARFKKYWQQLYVYVIPVTMKIIEEEAILFDKLRSYIDKH